MEQVANHRCGLSEKLPDAIHFVPERVCDLIRERTDASGEQVDGDEMLCCTRPGQPHACAGKVGLRLSEKFLLGPECVPDFLFQEMSVASPGLSLIPI